MFLIKSELIYVHQCSNRVAQHIFYFNLSHMRIQQFNVNRQLQIRSRHLYVSRCNQRVKYEAYHHFRGCSPGLVDGDVLTMETSLDWPHTLTLLTQVIALQFIWLINLPVKQHIISTTQHNSGINVNLMLYRQTKGILL